MTDKPFDFGDAVFHFFKTFGRRPGATLWIAFWHALLYVAVGALVFFLVGAPMVDLFRLALADATLSEAEGLSFALRWLVMMFMIWPASVLLVALSQGMWMRLLTRDEVAAGIPIRFGSDELRLVGVNLLLIVVFSAVQLAFLFLLVPGIIIGAISGVAGSGEADATAAAGAIGGGFLLVFGLLAMWVVTIFLAVKFAPAPALTILDRRFRFFDAWPATKGVFWLTLLAYIVVFALIMVLGNIAALLVVLVFLGALVVPIMEMVGNPGAFENDPAAAFEMIFASLNNPVSIIFLALGVLLLCFLQSLYEAMIHSVGAYVARRHRTEIAPPAVTDGSPPQETGLADAPGEDPGGQAG